MEVGDVSQCLAGLVSGLLRLHLLMLIRFSGGPLPSGGLVLGRGSCFAFVGCRLGGHQSS